MLKTKDSHQPRKSFWKWVEVRATNPETVSTMAEIELYLAGVKGMWAWLFYVYSCREGPRWCEDEFEIFRTSYLKKLQARYDLTKTYKFESETKKDENYYRERYALYDLKSTDPVSRPVIMVNVTNLLNYMKKIQPHFEEHVTPEQYAQCQKHLKDTEKAFESWMREARRRVIPSVVDMRRMEETGRRPHKSNMETLLDRLYTYII